jgi:hypothetical protein
MKPLITSVSPSGHRISTPQPDPGFFRATKVGRCSDILGICACGGSVQASYPAIIKLTHYPPRPSTSPPNAISESWIRNLHLRLGVGAETSQNAPAAISESPSGIAERGACGRLDNSRTCFAKHEGFLAKHSLTKFQKALRNKGRGRGGTGRRKGLKIPRWQRRVGSSPTARTNGRSETRSYRRAQVQERPGSIYRRPNKARR